MSVADQHTPACFYFWGHFLINVNLVSTDLGVVPVGIHERWMNMDMLCMHTLHNSCQRAFARLRVTACVCSNCACGLGAPLSLIWAP